MTCVRCAEVLGEDVSADDMQDILMLHRCVPKTSDSERIESLETEVRKLSLRVRDLETWGRIRT